MLLGGDEIGRTQRGNNNAYCQDNELSWYDWEHVDRDLLAFVRELAKLRRAHPVFRRRGWFQGRPIRHPKGGKALPDIAWLAPDGEEMTDEHWEQEVARSLQVFVNGHGTPTVDERGEPVVDSTFLIVFHAHPEDREFTLPASTWGAQWRRVLDTERGFARRGNGEIYDAGAKLRVLARSLWLLERVS
jgi:isoamylase